MAKVEYLDLSLFTGLANLNGLYLIGYAWLFGMCTLDDFDPFMFCYGLGSSLTAGHLLTFDSCLD